MKKVFFLLVMLASSLHSLTAQSGLFMPLEFRKAYEKGTRRPDGKVARAYWQNTASYDMKVTLDPYSKMLTGQATITYTNKSPDSLTNIVFHAYADYYKAGSIHAGFFGSMNDELISDGMVVDKLIVQDKEIDMKDRKTVRYRGTNYRVKLPEKLAPGKSVQLSINWHEEIPGKGFERAGAIDSTSMFVAYWYPEIAVVDDIDGWDQVVYDSSTEFYHDISDYKVEIEVPENFMLWASVAPDNPKEVYSKKVLQRLEAARLDTAGMTVYGEDDFKIKKSKKTNTWKYTASGFRDFCFALSDHFIWEAGLYKDEMGEYFIHTAYPVAHPEFGAVLKTIGGSIKLFHTEFPVYPFPYRNFTIFNGLQGGGMEFPGMANDEEVSGAEYSQWTGRTITDYEANFGLSLHEMCHMYFPFLMGINEKKYAWMDEGMANFAEYFNGEGDYSYDNDNSYLASQYVCPPMVPSYTQPQVSGINSYTIGSRSYQALYELLGKDMFLQCMKVYIDTWKNKHPTPYDFMFSFNTTSGQDLNWFWQKWYFDWGYPDIGIESYQNGELLIKNEGRKPIPFRIEYVYEDDSTKTEDVKTGVWKSSDTFKVQVPDFQKVKTIRLYSAMGGDVVKENNVWSR
jgi:hypothetical protein